MKFERAALVLIVVVAAVMAMAVPGSIRDEYGVLTNLNIAGVEIGEVGSSSSDVLARHALTPSDIDVTMTVYPAPAGKLTVVAVTGQELYCGRRLILRSGEPKTRMAAVLGVPPPQPGTDPGGEVYLYPVILGPPLGRATLTVVISGHGNRIESFILESSEHR